MNKKFDFLFRQFCLSLHVSKKTDEVWFSSAQDLETRLKERGITVYPPLYRRYKMPGGVSQQAYLKKKNSLNTIGRYKAGDVARFVECLPHKDGLRKKYDALSAEERVAFDKYLVDLAKQENLKIEAECKIIRAMNPDLQDLDVPNDIDFLSGVVYGFAPAEIKYFSDVRDKNLDWRQTRAEYEGQDMLSQRLGFSIGYMLSKDTINLIYKSVKKNGRG